MAINYYFIYLLEKTFGIIFTTIMIFYKSMKTNIRLLILIIRLV